MLQSKSSFMLVVVGLLILVIVSSVCPLTSDSNRNQDGLHPLGLDTNQLADYEEHDPILITSDDDFETQGWPGNGTLENPYAIEDLMISAEYECIKLGWTQAHFVIRNCLFTDAEVGIEITSSANGLISAFAAWS